MSIDLRAARANRDFGTDKKRIRTKITVMNKSNNGLGFYTRSSIAHGWFFIRAQSVIRADGLSSAQHRTSATTGGTL
jgi:hypothetical protein